MNPSKIRKMCEKGETLKVSFSDDKQLIYLNINVEMMSCAPVVILLGNADLI